MSGFNRVFISSVCAVLVLTVAQKCFAKARFWQGEITIATYGWQEDINPKFWALESGAKGSKTLRASIIYPYTMQDHLSREKQDRTYKAFFLENEYLKITCLPELGGRLHSVFDKSTNEEMFHINNVIKPSMIAMRGAFISGGVEWNAGPHAHTVTIMSPVDVIAGQNKDGSAYLEVSNLEKSLRTRWTVRLTLHPGRSYLDEKIRIFNPTDGMQPYYFWNCTAFPCRKGTRFIYPMSLGTDHNAIEFFNWPIHEGKDLSWLKNYDKWASIFAYQCDYDFFGAYDVDYDRGIVQFADHHELSGKKAWTWGTWEYGLVSQQNLTDEDGPYIEVQSGPLPTQSDYGMLWPRQGVSWREWWYPVHGLGEGFEYATRDVAIQSTRSGGNLNLRLIASGKFPNATCILSKEANVLLEKQIDLSPSKTTTVSLPAAGQSPIDVTIKTKQGQVLALYRTKLPVKKVTSPELPAKKNAEQLTVEEIYLKALKFDRATNRNNARKYYEMAVAKEPHHVLSLRGLAVLNVEAGLYEKAIQRLEKALELKPNDDGLSWYFLGVSHLRLGNYTDAVNIGYRAAKCFGTKSIGNDLAGRAHMRLGEYSRAADAFAKAVRANPDDDIVKIHFVLALHKNNDTKAALKLAKSKLYENPTDLFAGSFVALQNDKELKRFVTKGREFVGEDDFEIIEVGIVFAEVGLFDEAIRLMSAFSVDAVDQEERSPLPLYYMAYFARQKNDSEGAADYLKQAANIYRDFVFPSRPQAIEVLKFAIQENPRDSHAHLHLGNLYANLGRLDEAVKHWKQASQLDESLNIAFRNLGFYHWVQKKDYSKAGQYYLKAITARADDQTLYRDLAEILVEAGKTADAIKLLETMLFEGQKRSDIIIIQARAYIDNLQYTEAIDLLDSTPYFVNWEGSSVTKDLFDKAHISRGKQRFEDGDFAGALEDFDAALTYPENLGVGRRDKLQEAMIQYWRGKTLEKLLRYDQARLAWKKGADGQEGSDEQNEYRQLCALELSLMK